MNCELCHGTGWIEVDGGGRLDCPDCRPAGPAPEQPDPTRHVLSFEDLEALVREQVTRNLAAPGRGRAQAALDRAAHAALIGGEIHLASALLLVSAHRVAGQVHLANQVLFQQAIDLGLSVRGQPLTRSRK